MHFLRPLCPVGLLIWTCLASHAQNTAGVFPPIVNEGHQAIEYRFGYDPDAERHVQRFHYEQSENGDRMWRGVFQYRESSESGVDFDFFQGELFWQLSEDDEPWQTGFRFDLRVRDDDRPGFVGAHWTNLFPVGDTWTGRAVLMTSVDFGSNARDGVFIQTRGQLDRPLSNGDTFGFQMFNVYGSTNKFPNFADQSHQAGPFYVARFDDGWSVLGNALVGLSSSASDLSIAVWITKRL